MASVPHIAHETIDAAVEEALSRLLPADLGDKPHLPRAVLAERIAAVASHLEKSEVAAAIDRDGASWGDVAHAFGISLHDAQQRFRTTPRGLPE
jgi:hypothetical protein